MANELDRVNMPHDYKLLVQELMEMVNELSVSVADIKTMYDAHTHNADGAQGGAYFTSPPRTDSATVTAGSDSALAAAPTAISH